MFAGEDQCVLEIGYFDYEHKELKLRPNERILGVKSKLETDAKARHSCLMLIVGRLE